MREKREKRCFAPRSFMSCHFVDYLRAQCARMCLEFRESDRVEEREKARQRKEESELRRRKKREPRDSLFSFLPRPHTSEEDQENAFFSSLLSFFQKLTPCARSRVWACRLCGCVLTIGALLGGARASMRDQDDVELR